MRAAVDGELAQRALSSAAEIARALRPRADELGGDLGSGAAGMALTYAYLDEALPDEGFGGLADELLGRAMQVASAEPLPPWLYGGFIGIAWVLEHVAGAGDGEPDPNAEIDSALAELLAAESWRGDYDLLIGLAGVALYALERSHRPGARRLVVRVIDHLERLAEPAERGLTWHTSTAELPSWQQELAPDGYYNLGMAHGVPGLIAVLARALAAGIEPARTGRLLRGAASWVIGAGASEGEARYAQWLTDKDARCRRPARSAWCYGDLGPAASLYRAGVDAGEAAWIEIGLELARGVARRPPDRAGVFDACLCHGTGSLIQFFTRFYRATGERWAREATAFWVERTLETREPGAGIAGYQFSSMGEDGQMIRTDNGGFLAGAAGTALALVAAATPLPCDWDRALLLDLPRG